MKRALAAAVLLFPLLIPQILSAYDFTEDTLFIELWTELEPAVELPSSRLDPEQEGRAAPAEERNKPLFRTERRDSGPLSTRVAVERVLEEARIVISSMIYGYRVEYTPLDRAREVKERFVVEPIARIERGDPRLETVKTWTKEGRFYARFRYLLAEHQILRREGWKSNTIPSTIARGSAPLFEGYRGKYRSFEEAIKEGLRAHLRPREFNKPREIRAQVLFLEPPYTRINAGGYYSKVHMKLRIEEVVPYGAY